MIQTHIYNKLMRQIINEKFENNQTAFSQAVSESKQDINKYYNNKKEVSHKTFRKWADKCGYRLKIIIELRKTKKAR